MSPVLVLNFLLDVSQHVGCNVTLKVFRQLLRGMFQVLLIVLPNNTASQLNNQNIQRAVGEDVVFNSKIKSIDPISYACHEP